MLARHQSTHCLSYVILTVAICLSPVEIAARAATERAQDQTENTTGLLFHLSSEQGFAADFARGNPLPSVINDIEIIPDGAVGAGFRCPHFTQLMAYWAAGNIYAQRGTLSFFWRARDDIGSTPFPIFQVSYSDHSSLDVAWLRIDFNGQGFDGFVTDINLARIRVSHASEDLPAPDQWIHFGLSWDENIGVRFYVNGELVGEREFSGRLDAGLDQFGAHGDVIGPQDVGTLEYFVRGGDLDEIRIYDQMLTHLDMGRLARAQTPAEAVSKVRRLEDPVYRRQWWHRYGWNRSGDFPPVLHGSSTSVRKVEIHDVFDIKQWVWKATDGIRETTWPHVYNRSPLPGRTDYFIRPDWNRYALSGMEVTFKLPEESWNHLEIAGGAFGSFSLLGYDRESGMDQKIPLFERPPDQERTFHREVTPRKGGKIRFENAVQEMPLGEFSAYYVRPGRAPQGTTQLQYTVRVDSDPDYPVLDPLLEYIHGRFPPDERTTVAALPEGAPRTPRTKPADRGLPLVHVLIPFEFRIERPGEYRSRFSYTWENLYGGLDGVAIDLPPLDVAPTHGEYFALNVQVKDPIWPDRNLLNFSFSVKPGEAKSLWLDTRDRILPNGHSLYLTVAGSGSDFGAASLDGARIRLIFKDFDEARKEHEVDRFTQIRDNVGNFLEWGTNRKFLKLYERYSRDIADLFRVNPHHRRARYYWSYLNGEQGWPHFVQQRSPEDVPVWAFRQIELLKLYKEFVNWWIDERQIENGELGGGLSDDGDLTNYWPGAALMGIEPEKITDSVHRLLDAMYENGMFTDGLNTIMTDDLHTYEEGVNVQPQVMLLDYGHPKTVERMMETARALERITGFDDLGHRHIRSFFFSAEQISEDPVWAQVRTVYGYLILHSAMVLVEFNGHPEVKGFLLELADGLLAHRTRGEDGNYDLPGAILFPSGENVPYRDTWATYDSLGSALYLFWAAWKWTGDEKYLQPIYDRLDQGRFEVLRAINANAFDLLEERKGWGRQLARLMDSPQTRTGHHHSDDDPLSLDSSDQSFLQQATAVASASLPVDQFFRHVAWQVTGRKEFLEGYYAEQIQAAVQRMPMFTEDHWWVDRVNFPSEELQRSRLGGVALVRSATFPGHVVSWRFPAPATEESVAILVPESTPNAVRILAFNLENEAVTAVMTPWNLAPGLWELTVGIDDTGDGFPDRIVRNERLELERSAELHLEFPSKVESVVLLRLVSEGAPLWERPDLGIGADSVRVEADRVRVVVHSIGAVDAPATTVALVDPSGTVLASAGVPPLPAPLDLLPKTAEVQLEIPAGTLLEGCQVVLNPDNDFREITRRNNAVALQ